jgi:hypothetical protein
MSKKETFEQLQEDTIELIKNKKDYMKKAPKTYELKQIIRAIVATLVLLGIGAFAGITINNSINSTINSQVKEQVKSFTVELEAKQ